MQLTAGAHQVQVFSEDRAGNVSERHSVIVADGYTWLTPIDSDGAIAGRAGRTIPVKFSVTTVTGASVRDASVLVDVLDRTGKVVSGRALDAGPIESARALEGMVAVIVNLNKRYKAHVGLRLSGLK